MRKVTPEMRRYAIQRLSEGHPPSTIGTVLPSPHPEYLLALFLGPVDDVQLFFDGEQAAGSSAPGNMNVVYLDQWSVHNLVGGAMSQAPATTASTDALPEYLRVTMKVQQRTTDKLSKVERQVVAWKNWDDAERAREDAALEVIINDPMIHRPGSLCNDIEHWRNRLSWVPPQDQRSYHYGDRTGLAGPLLKFVAFESGSSTVVSLKSPQLIKYTFSNISGTFRTDDELVEERNRILRDRNSWVIHNIGQIEHEMRSDLVMNQAGFVLQALDNILFDRTSSTESTATQIRQTYVDQKETKNRRLKKQVPKRGLGSVKFVPEDDGLTGFSALEASMKAVPATDAPAGEGQQPDNEGYPVPIPPKPEPAPYEPEKPEPRRKGKGKGKRKTAAEEKTTTSTRNLKTRVTRASSKQPSSQPQAQTQIQTQDPEQASTSSNNRKRATEPGEEAGPNKVAKTSPTQPLSPIKEEAEETKDQPAPIRKSSRIIKRKASELEDKEETAKPAKVAKGEKKIRPGAPAPLIQEPTKKQALKMVEGMGLTPLVAEKKQGSKGKANPAPAAVTTAATTVTTTSPGTPAKPASSSEQPQQEQVSATTTTTPTANNPASNPFSALPPVTTTQRAELTALFPWLVSIPEKFTPVHLRPTTGPKPRGNKAKWLVPDAATTAAAAAYGPNYTDKTREFWPRDAWVQFLARWGRGKAAVEELNGMVGRLGEERWGEVHWGVLGGLRRQVARMRGVEGEVGAEVRWRWSEE